MARIDDEIQSARRGAGNLLDAWEQIRASERYMRFNGLITSDERGDAVPTDAFKQEQFIGENSVASPQEVCAVLNAMNHAEIALTEAGFAPFYILRS